MTGRRHIVRTGESLWRIAEETLGHGARWPRIWRYNNRAAVIRVTGRGIPNPDLIYPGQILLIPILPNTGVTRLSGSAPAPASGHGPAGAVLTAPSSNPKVPGGGPLSRQLPHAQSPISIKYRLDDIKFPPIVQPGLIMEVRMTGDVLLMTQKAYPAVYVTQRRELEFQAVSQANQALNSLINDTRLIYDSRENKLTYRAMLVTKSSTPNAPAMAMGMQIDSMSPVPKLRFEFRFPKLQGSLPLFNYSAIDIKIVVELTPKREDEPRNTAQPARIAQPATNWQRVLGTGLLVTAGALVVGTLVEDFFTAGAGIADDAPSFAAAAGAVARGLQMIRGAVLLPAAATAAAVSLSVRFEGGGQGAVQPTF
jgi:LysM domain-containing protein